MDDTIVRSTLGLLNFPSNTFIVDQFDYLKINYFGAGTKMCNEYFIHYLYDGESDTYIVTNTAEMDIMKEACPRLYVVSIKDNNSLSAFANIVKAINDFKEFIFKAKSGYTPKEEINKYFEYCRPSDLMIAHTAKSSGKIIIKPFEAYAEYSFQKWVAMQLIIGPYINDTSLNKGIGTWDLITTCEVCGKYIWPCRCSVTTCGQKCTNAKKKAA